MKNQQIKPYQQQQEHKKKIDDQRVKLDLLHSFGSSFYNGYKNALGIMEEDGYNLLFPVGKYIGIKPHDKNDMVFLRLTENLEKIICLTISPNKKFVAVCERLKQDEESFKRFPQVSVYNIKSNTIKANLQNEKKQFSYPDTQTEAFIAMCFSHDSRFLACLTDSPEYKLVFIDLLANKKDIAGLILKIPITKVTISPKDNHQVAISGINCFKILRVQEGSFAYVSENIKRLPQNQTFTDHIWFDEKKIALSNDKGEIYIIQENEVKQYIESGFQIEGLGINCMVAFTKGLIIGSDNGVFALWLKNENLSDENNEDDFNIIYIRSWSSDRGQCVLSIQITQAEDLMAVSFKSNDIATFDLTKLLPQVPESIESLKQNINYMEKKLKFDYVFGGFHLGPISCMDVCLQRPLIVTCSQKDSTIRIWNYVNFRCELARKFITDNNEKSPLLSVAFHPSGYYLAAGFIDKFRVYHVLKDELKLFKEYPVKNATLLRFSSGGQYLAVAYLMSKNQSNQYCINIYNSYSIQIIVTLNGPPSQVTEIIWGPFDEFILSISIDGTVYRCKQFKIQFQNNNQQNQLDKGIVYGYMDQNELEQKEKLSQQYGNNTILYGQQIQDMDFELKNYKITQFCFLQSFYNYYGIIAGTNQGAIKVKKKIQQQQQQIKVFGHHFSSIPYETIQAHCGQVTQIKTSPDGRYIFSGGEDGAIFIFQVINNIQIKYEIKQKRCKKQYIKVIINKQNPRALVVDEHLADVIMVYKNEIEGYVQEQEKIQAEYKDFKQRMNENLQEERSIMEFKMQKIKEQYENELVKQKKIYDELNYNKQVVEQDYKIVIQTLEEKHLKGVEELEGLYEKKLGFENEKYMQQEMEMKEEALKFERTIKELQKKHDNNINMLKTEFNQNFHKAQKVYENMKLTADDVKKLYEEKLSQQEEEHEIEVRQILENNQKECNDLKGKFQELKNKSKKINTQLEEIQEQNINLKKTQEDKDNQINSLKSKLKEQISQNELLRSEFKSLEEIHKKKEKKIQDYKYKISDLQKSKHVLSFRTTEMRKSLEPKESQIEKLKEELFKLEGEFEEMLQVAQKSNEELKKMQITVENLKKNLKSQIEQTKSKDQYIRQIIMDIYNCVEKKDRKEWADEMKRFYQIYVLDTQKDKELKQSINDEQGQIEMQKQVQYLEKSIYQLDKASIKLTLRRDKEIYKKTKENTELINEINEMRKNNQKQQAEIQNLLIQLDNNKKENNNFKNEIKRIKSQLLKKQKEFNMFEENNTQNKVLNPFFESSLDKQQPFNNTSCKFQPANTLPVLKKMNKLDDNSKSQGKIIKGLNFDIKTLNTFDKAKMMETVTDLELIKQKLASIEKQYKGLQNKVKKHLNDYKCGDFQLENEINKSNFNNSLFDNHLFDSQVQN
ncbi:WD repeat protein [Ichthyophthirius multifiliis]|uniref:WD repeat protein n=1 Tax=Ichthyophthirius multifiliis TaxID=5932 RepID=G0QY36_ICHMU|nr:WD repeat protein [Ichthyophthirius multifiliis]EGR29862.1 WD repeat protein [Ichthyophthirius multifiliis]|eukprot:XP_004031098.1 WD repeat protein [Ichthyophthirius multifiliis]